jgi:hypothetical protein
MVWDTCLQAQAEPWADCHRNSIQLVWGDRGHLQDLLNSGIHGGLMAFFCQIWHNATPRGMDRCLVRHTRNSPQSLLSHANLM